MTDTHTYTDPGERGQTRASWRNEMSCRGVLLRLIRENPTLDREEIEPLYLAKCKEPLRAAGCEVDTPLIDEALIAKLANDWNEIHKIRKRQLTPEQIAARKAAEDAAIAAAAARIKETVLLDLIQPNGKALRECTGAECRQFGGWHIAIADRIGDAGIVGAMLDEKEVGVLFSQHAKP